MRCCQRHLKIKLQPGDWKQEKQLAKKYYKINSQPGKVTFWSLLITMSLADNQVGHQRVSTPETTSGQEIVWPILQCIFGDFVKLIHNNKSVNVLCDCLSTFPSFHLTVVVVVIMLLAVHWQSHDAFGLVSRPLRGCVYDLSTNQKLCYSKEMDFVAFGRSQAGCCLPFSVFMLS